MWVVGEREGEGGAGEGGELVEGGGGDAAGVVEGGDGADGGGGCGQVGGAGVLVGREVSLVVVWWKS